VEIQQLLVSVYKKLGCSLQIKLLSLELNAETNLERQGYSAVAF